MSKSDEIYRGVRLCSRQGIEDELILMRMVVDALDHHAALVSEMFYDSNACADLSIAVIALDATRGSSGTADIVARCAAGVMRARLGGWNGIHISLGDIFGGQSLVELDPWWLEDEGSS